MGEISTFQDVNFDAFVETSNEKQLDALFGDRFSMSDPAYASVSRGFPEPVAIFPWFQTRKLVAKKRRYDDAFNDHDGKSWSSNRESYGRQEYNRAEIMGYSRQSPRDQEWGKSGTLGAKRKRGNSDMNRNYPFYHPHR